MKNLWRVYIKPFDDTGTYGSWLEVTDDVVWSSLGSVNTDLDNSEYNIGVFRVSNFKISLRNDEGFYSDVGNDQSIFKYKRSESQVKITWEIEADGGPYVGVAESESGYLSEETTIFVGLLNDDSLTMDIAKQTVDFTCLGRESIFTKTIVPFGSISNGDLYSTVILALLNQSSITTLLTVSALNISCGLDQTIDTISGLQNKTVTEGLNKLLLASNSVLYIKDDTIYVSPRTPGADVAFTFYGQASPNGPENIVTLNNIKSGINKTFNYFTWADTAFYATDATSTQKYGVIKKEIQFDFCTDIAKQQNILDDLRDEFALPKQEFDIATPFKYDSLMVNLLDKVSIDYPTIYVAPTGDSDYLFPICGVAICGEAVLPRALWAFSVEATDYYKVIGKSLNMKTSIITFKVRLI